MKTMSPFAAILHRFVSGQGGWIAVLAIVLSAAPASAQALADEGWALQGSAYVGASIAASGLSPDFTARIAARSGTQVLDLSVSAIPVRYHVPQGYRWHIAALAGLERQRNRLGFGFRSGVLTGQTALGERKWTLVMGPHAMLAVPVSPRFEARAEAGVHFHDPQSWWLAAPRGFLRMGIEGRKR